jgi:hypothetical protein
MQNRTGITRESRMPMGVAMNELLLFLALVGVCEPQALAQSHIKSNVRPITAPVRSAGTFHLGIGTWTRSDAMSELLSTDIIYNNTCPQPYFWNSENGQTLTDEGRIPSPTGPTMSGKYPATYNAAPGCQTSYLVNAFRIGYCTDRLTFSVAVGFQEAYPNCSVPAPQYTFNLTGLPHSSQLGLESCWLVTVDLQTAGRSFEMKADGTGAYTPPPQNNLFGCSFHVTSDVGALSKTGPLLAGDYNHYFCSGVDGTRWDTVPGSAPPTWPANVISGPNGTPEDGTGMDTLSQIRVDGGTGSQGCFFWGSPMVSFNLRMYANAHCPPSSGVPFCAGDGSLTTACPCGNAGIYGHGCENSKTTGGATLTVTGNVNPDTIILYALGELPSALSIFLQGSANIPSGTAFGDGLRCSGGILKRIGVHNAVSGVASYPQGGDLGIKAKSAVLGDPIPPGATRYYQTYYRDPSISFCPSPQGNTWNVSSGIQLVWQ